MNIFQRIKHILAPEKTTPVKGFAELAKYFNGRKGLEIGGPSRIFRRNNFIPVYPLMKQLDGVNFSGNTVWTGELETSKGFRIKGRRVGDMYIADAVDLSIVPDNQYDFILSSNNIEHIANPLKAIEQWVMKLKTGGLLVIVAPRKESNFDHRREVVKFSHLLDDYRNQTGEDDLTHLDEILSLHDLSRDLPAGTPEQFRARSLDNLNNRCLHQHVFDDTVLQEMLQHFGMEVVGVERREKDNVVVGVKL